MVRFRGEEHWATECLRNALPGIRVENHDDGSQPGMHDLDLFRGDVRVGACEITATLDPELHTLWKMVNGRDSRWIENGLLGGWLLVLVPTCKAKLLKTGLRSLLSDLEAADVTSAEAADRWDRSGFAPRLRELGIRSARRSDTDFPGSVYFTIDLPNDKSGGWVQENGDRLAAWIGEFAKRPDQAHNVQKLIDSGATERHLFVIFPGFSTAPFDVTDILTRADGALPTIPPSLPEGVTHLWCMSGWATGDLFAWNSDKGWTRYAKFVLPRSEEI